MPVLERVDQRVEATLLRAPQLMERMGHAVVHPLHLLVSFTIEDEHEVLFGLREREVLASFGVEYQKAYDWVKGVYERRTVYVRRVPPYSLKLKEVVERASRHAPLGNVQQLDLLCSLLRTDDVDFRAYLDHLRVEPQVVIRELMR